MALLDLSLVTQALTRLVEEHVSISPAWLPRARPTVSPQPADKLSGDALGFYLYHLEEDSHYKNQPPPSPDRPPVRFTPMALNLHYQLTARSAVDDDPGALQTQLLFGCALKALHDFPVVDDGTSVNGVDILSAVGLDGNGNRLRLSLHPIPPSDAVSYWTAGTTPLRLAAYYQVSVVLLEPDEPVTRAGRVLDYGVFTFVTGAPRLDGSSNAISFTPPGGGDPRRLELRPAVVPVDGTVTLHGTDLAGDGTELLLSSPRWSDPRVVDGAWGVTASTGEVTATVRESAGGEDVLPGIHWAAVRVARVRQPPGGPSRRFEQTSNVTPFTIAPRIDTVTAPDAAGVFTVTGYVFQHADLAADDVQLFVGGDRLPAGTAGGLAPGEFAVVDAATLEIRLPAGLAPGEQVPVRIVVNGAESAPRWVQSP